MTNMGMASVRKVHPLFLLGVCHKSIARILLGCIELDNGKETLQSQLSERRQKIIREKLETWCADGGYRDTILNMVTLSRSLDIPKTELSKYLSGLNTTFRFWLAEIRFEAAKKMILEKPNYSNDMISAECGFYGSATFFMPIALPSRILFVILHPIVSWRKMQPGNLSKNKK